MTVNKEVYSDGRSGMSGLYPVIQDTPNAERFACSVGQNHNDNGREAMNNRVAHVFGAYSPASKRAQTSWYEDPVLNSHINNHINEQVTSHLRSNDCLKPYRQNTQKGIENDTNNGMQPVGKFERIERLADDAVSTIDQAMTHAEGAQPIRLSFQLMTRAEPTTMVIATIQSLLAIKAADDEILIIDNNHTKRELYKPLADFCHGLEPHLNVHFYHIDAVAGFKSGALNLALGLMNPSASHVVVVDSDYQALPHARDAIISAIHEYPEHALLQFPQFYRDADKADVHSELNHYFNHHLYRSFNRQRALSTGTYAVIRRDALVGLGGWSGASITEDAQMGVLLHRMGLHSRFIPKVIATGILPTTLCDLIAQRQRWVYGNVQVLNRYFVTPSSLTADSSANTNVSQTMGERLQYMRAHFSQLSAWINFTGIFIVLHVCTLLIVLTALVIGAQVDMAMLLTPLYVVYAAYGVFLLRRLWAYAQDRSPLNQQVAQHVTPTFTNKLRAWALHLNFWEIGALSWWPVLWGRDKPFVCTPKQALISSRRSVWQANVCALPKLLLILNVITLAVTSPLSALYSPLLFVSALVVTVLKLWSAKVAFDNYGYPPEVDDRYADEHDTYDEINNTVNQSGVIKNNIAKNNNTARDNITQNKRPNNTDPIKKIYG
ncbi:glycosyltransferase family 2 protein [Psychrobacter celer]|uniref:glycosyltransferase family 2 protein n=1 Tax=Psychrobacter celer TaxID=306572 RepID=UPI003FD315B0